MDCDPCILHYSTSSQNLYCVAKQVDLYPTLSKSGTENSVNRHCGDKCHLGIVAWIAFYRHHRIDIRFIRLVRMVRLYGRRGIRNGRTDYHYPHGWRNAGTNTV